MPLFPRFSLKKKPKQLDQKKVDDIVASALEPYIKREEIQKYIRQIERDEHKRKIWDGLSNRTKIKLLRYAVSKKEELKHGKK